MIKREWYVLVCVFYVKKDVNTAIKIAKIDDHDISKIILKPYIVT
jgi:hypothetical protein